MFLEIPSTDNITKCYIKPFDIKAMFWNNNAEITTILFSNGNKDIKFQTNLTPQDIEEGILRLEDKQLKELFNDLNGE